MSGMFNLLPPEMCQVCFHEHEYPDICFADDYAPGPDGDIYLGLCECRVNADADYVDHLVIVFDENGKGHTEYRD